MCLKFESLSPACLESSSFTASTSVKGHGVIKISQKVSRMIGLIFYRTSNSDNDLIEAQNNILSITNVEYLCQFSSEVGQSNMKSIKTFVTASKRFFQSK